MLDITSLWLFIVAVFLLSVTPGPDLAYVVGQSMANGRRAGVLLFFVSFFPQFVVPGGDHQTESFLLLGVVYTLVAFLTDAIFALLAGGAAGVVSGNRGLQKLMDRVVGVTFIGLGIRLSLTQR